MRDLIQKIDRILNESVEEDNGLFQIGDEFGISFSEDLEIATTIVGFVEDGIVVELDDTAIGIMESNGSRFVEGYLEEGLRDPKDNPCWKGYKPVGTKQKGGRTVPNCVPKESIEEAGPFGYGAKRPRKGSVADLADKKRREQERGKQPIEPQDQRVGTAKVTKGVAEGLGDYIGRKLRVKTTKGKPNPKNAPKWATALGQTPQGAWHWLEKDGPVETPDSDRYFPLSGKTEFTGFVSEYEGTQGVAEETQDPNLAKAYRMGNAAYKAGNKDALKTIPQQYKAMWIKGWEDGERFAKEGIDEAEYQGRKVTLNKPTPNTDGKSKTKVYVRDPKTGNVKKVTFGDPNMRIKKSNPERRKSFRARHNCSNPGPKTKARYWSCRAW